MTVNEVFDAVQNGTMSREDFEKWVVEQRDEAYLESSVETAYQHTIFT